MSNDLSVNMRLAENRRRDEERRRAAATFVPSDDQVRGAYALRYEPSRQPHAAREFDRWLAEHDQAVRVAYEEQRSASVLVTSIEGKPAPEWLAEHDRQVAEKAWAECASHHALVLGFAAVPLIGVLATNPHAKQEPDVVRPLVSDEDAPPYSRGGAS